MAPLAVQRSKESQYRREGFTGKPVASRLTALFGNSKGDGAAVPNNACAAQRSGGRASPESKHNDRGRKPISLLSREMCHQWQPRRVLG